MDLLKQHPKAKLIFLWLVSNYFAWPIGMILSIILSHLTVGFFFDEPTNMIVGLVTASTIGLAQWLVLIKFLNLRKWWIFVPGIIIGFPFAYVVLYLEGGNELPLLFDSDAVLLPVFFSVFVLISSLIQSQLASMNRMESLVWILCNGLAAALITTFYSLAYAGLIMGLTTLPAFLLLLNNKKLDVEMSNASGS